MKKTIWHILTLCILVIAPLWTAQAEDSRQIVNLMIDISGSSAPSEEQLKVDTDNIKNIYNAMVADRIPSTWFLTRDVSSSQISLYITQLGLYGNIEFGMSGNNSNEKLSSMSYSEQLEILEISKKFADAAHVCGQNEKPILGFKPQSYDQNQDTYKAVDKIGLEYNAGFQAGLLYAPGHENDLWPYSVEGHNFYAVPVSTISLSGKEMVLQDSYFKDSGLSASQWHDALVSKFDEIEGKDEPLVIDLTTSVSGSGDHLKALIDFIAYAQSQDASFVTTKQLVDMAKAGIHDASELSEATNESAGCTTCGQSAPEQSITEVTITASTNDTMAATSNAAES